MGLRRTVHKISNRTRIHQDAKRQPSHKSDDTTFCSPIALSYSTVMPAQEAGLTSWLHVYYYTSKSIPTRKRVIHAYELNLQQGS